MSLRTFYALALMNLRMGLANELLRDLLSPMILVETKTALSRFVRGNRIIELYNPAEMLPLPATADVGEPLPGGCVPSHSGVATGVPHTFSRILSVFRSGGVSEVLQPVVTWVAIDVVNGVMRPFAVGDRPDHSVRKDPKLDTEDGDHARSIAKLRCSRVGKRPGKLTIPRRASGLSRVPLRVLEHERLPLLPVEQSGIPVIVKDHDEKIWGWKSPILHQLLLVAMPSLAWRRGYHEALCVTANSHGA